ncbi:MFS transporter [Sporobolomyces koalae]|uniref:MFS transporter n=1 Tax=Sporobolomyces koalae TaxID=500713 RepID=UPI003172876D
MAPPPAPSHPSVIRQSSRTPLLGPAFIPSPTESERGLPDIEHEGLEDKGSDHAVAEPTATLERVTTYGSEDSADGDASTSTPTTHRAQESGLTPLDLTLEEIGVGRYQLQLLVLCGLGWLADNMYLQAVAIILPRVQKEFDIGDRWIGLLSTSIFAGMLVGATGWGSYSDAKGRLPAFNLTLFFTSLFGIASAFSPNFPMLCLALFCLGTGVGGSMPTDGTLFLENLPKSRHFLLTALSVFFSLGAIVTSTLSLIIFPRFTCTSSPDAAEAPCDPRSEDRGWRILLGCLGLISAIMFFSRVLFFKLHESAKFLVASKRASAAVVSLQRISKFNGTNSTWSLDDVVDHVPVRSPVNNPRVDAFVIGGEGDAESGMDWDHRDAGRSGSSSALLTDSDREEGSGSYPSPRAGQHVNRSRRPAWIDRLPRGWRTAAADYVQRVAELLEGSRRRTTLLIWAIWTLASAGYTIFNVFLPKFLEGKLSDAPGGSSGDSDDSLWDYVFYTLAGLPGSIIGAHLVETSFGRTLTLAYSTLATSLGTMTFVFATGQTGVLLSSMVVSLAATLMYAVIYSLTPEIFPTQLRGTAGGIASALSRLSGIFAPLLTGVLLSINISLPLVLSAMCFLATAACAWSLRGIEDELKLDDMSIDPKTYLREGQEGRRSARLLPVGLLAVALAAYTVQTELASYVQHTLGYKKPYFLFFCTHSGYMLLWPCHLLALRLLKIPVKATLESLVPLLARHFAPSTTTAPPHAHDPSPHSHQFPFPTSSFDASQVSLKTRWVQNLIRKVALLTIFISFPALSWYASVPLTSMADLTAIYNVFAFWAYLLSLKFLPHETTQTSMQARLKLFSVLLAVTGVFVIAYGDMIWGDQKGKEAEGSNRVLGNGLALFGSIAYAGYEVWYKIKIALPEPSSSSALPHTRISETSSLLSTRSSSPVPEGPAENSFEFPPPPSPAATQTTRTESTLSSISDDGVAPSPTVFLLYSNLITSLIGLFTFVFLWIPIPILDWIGWEEWQGFPPKTAWTALAGIIGGGVLFNGCFMVLLSLWGPVVASVANLLTLILVAICDALFVPSAPPLTRASLIGGAFIVFAFAGLIYGEYGISKSSKIKSNSDRRFDEEQVGYEEDSR